MAAFRRAIQIDPRYGKAHCNLGIIFAANKQREEALREFQQALAIDPNDAVARQKLNELQR